MRFDPVEILVDGDMSGDLFSFGIDANQHAIGSVQAVWTGSPVGTLILQVSNQIVQINPVVKNQATQVTEWSDYTCSLVDVNGAGNFLWNMNYMGFRWVRLKYSSTSGTGSLSATYSGKG